MKTDSAWAETENCKTEIYHRRVNNDSDSSEYLQCESKGPLQLSSIVRVKYQEITSKLLRRYIKAAFPRILPSKSIRTPAYLV